MSTERPHGEKGSWGDRVTIPAHILLDMSTVSYFDLFHGLRNHCLGHLEISKFEVSQGYRQMARGGDELHIHQIEGIATSLMAQEQLCTK